MCSLPKPLARIVLARDALRVAREWRGRASRVQTTIRDRRPSKRMVWISRPASDHGGLTHCGLQKLHGRPWKSGLARAKHWLMRQLRLTPSFKGLKPASRSASKAARTASAKKDTRCELVLRRALWGRGLRYKLHHPGLPGRPDIVFSRQRIAVFCDGDFWHGRDLEVRLSKLARGHNATYWVAKVRRNVQRDREIDAKLEASGWVVLHVWETDILKAPEIMADCVAELVASRTIKRQ